MRKSIAFLLAVSLLSASFTRPVFAESEDVPDTLAEQLSLPEESPAGSFSPELNSVTLLSRLIVSSYIAETSENGKVYLEELFSMFDNNIDPETVDPAVNAQAEQFLEAIRSLRMPDVRSEKLRTMQQESQAYILRQIVDDPAALLSFARTFDLDDLFIPGLFTPLDSPESYTVYQNPMDQSYYRDNAALSEEQTKILSDAREDLQSCLNDYAKNNELEAYVLSEEAARQLAECRNSQDLAEKMQFLTDSQETYAEYPGYWAVLAETCFRNEDYKQCLSAVQKYEQKQGPVFRKDPVYARLSAMAVVCLQKTVTINVTRVREIEKYLARLIRNTGNEDWALRYLASQAYIEIWRVSDNPYVKDEYIKNANAVIRYVVKYLVNKQRNSNLSYLADAVQLEAAAEASSEEKDEIKDLNTLIKEDHKTALPPVSLAVMVSADLMLDLTKRTQGSMEDAEAILTGDGSPLYLNEYLERLYNKDLGEVAIPEITFDKKKLTIPASYPAYDYSVKLTVEKNGVKTESDDWRITEVKRNGDEFKDWIAELSSDTNNKMKYEGDMYLTFEIIPTGIAPCRPLYTRFKTVVKKVFFFFEVINLEPAE